MRAENSGSCFGPLPISSSVACQHMVKGKGSDPEGQAVAAQGKLWIRECWQRLSQVRQQAQGF